MVNYCRINHVETILYNIESSPPWALSQRVSLRQRAGSIAVEVERHPAKAERLHRSADPPRHLGVESALVREKLECRLDVPYGPSADEILDIFPARQDGAPVVGAFLSAMGLPAELAADTWWVLVAAACSIALSLLRAPYEAALASQLRYDVIQYCEAAGIVFRAVFIVACFTIVGPALIFWGLAALTWSLTALVTRAP